LQTKVLPDSGDAWAPDAAWNFYLHLIGTGRNIALTHTFRNPPILQGVPE
jgi:hypothetical protein